SPAPESVTVISAGDPTALARSRASIGSGRGALLWTGVEDALYPAGWAANTGSLLRKGAVGLSGDERPATGALRRDAALLRYWAPLLGGVQPVMLPKPATGKFPEGVTVHEISSSAGAAVIISNTSAQPFHDDVRVIEPVLKRTMVVP